MNETSMSGAKPSHVASFWSHMFSFDAPVKAVPLNGANKAPIPSQTAVWFSALQSLRLSSLFEGLVFSPNFKCFALLAAFASWLLVVNWVKDYDHVPNKMVSHSTANLGVATATDRALVIGLKSAYPFGATGAAGPLEEQSLRIATGPGQAMSANYNGDQRFGSPTDYFSTSAPARVNAQEPILPTLVQPQTVQPIRVTKTNELNQPPAYNVQMNSMNGTWLRTIVSR